MSIFQKSVIYKYLKNLDEDKVNLAYDKFQKFYGDKERLHNIMQLKEENYQEGFLREIFVQTLGYTINPDKNYNLTTEFKNQKDSRKADGAIVSNTTRGHAPLAEPVAIGVIELKSTKTKDLESIKEQAFGYKNNQPNCKYVITSNFQNIRFYIDNATEYEEFNLFELSAERFKIFYLLLSKESILNHLPEKLKQETKFHDEQITQKLYKDYQAFKDRIFEFLCTGNPQYDKLTLFKKSQKLLDRFLFILFAEDSGLIPPNSISKIIDQWKQLQELEKNDSLYSRFQLFFTHLDKGHVYKQWGEIPAYNGGLFRYDEILDNPDLKLPDGLLQNHTSLLSAYDFGSEVDVNILGHIFEHSLSEIEEMEQNLQGFQNLEGLPKVSKRKKDGIFYTPKYITKYIVENTVGTLCNEKKTQLQIKGLLIDDTYYVQTRRSNSVQTRRGASLQLNKKGKDLFETLQNYKNWLLTLKILDPACGSGAFLNQTLDFLVGEHQQIDNIINELTGESIRYFDTDKQILENNIFGVDINEESVEIAKLSLWLRTAQRGRALSDLSDNIKCGNSLIDDPKVAGSKAFDWNTEFKDIMDKGGFDVVLGNPPYGAQLNNTEKDFFRTHYSDVHMRTPETFNYFILRIERLCHNNSIWGLIIPSSFLNQYEFEKSRKYILDNSKINTIVNLGDDIFQNVATPTCIMAVSKKGNNNTRYADLQTIGRNVVSTEIYNLSNYVIANNLLSNSGYSFIYKPHKTIINKCYKNPSLKNIAEDVATGISSGYDKAYIYTAKICKELHFENDLLKKLIIGGEINRYFKTPFSKKMIVYATNKTDIEKYPNILNSLSAYKRKLEQRVETKSGSIKWYVMLRPRRKKLFEQDKILIRQTANRILACYDTEKWYCLKSGIIVQLPDNSELSYLYLLALLNSKLIDFLYQDLVGESARIFPEVKPVQLFKLPIKVISSDKQAQIIEKSQLISALYEAKIKEETNFQRTLIEDKKITKTTKTIENFDELEFDTLKVELAKQKTRFALGKETNEWREYFDTTKQKVNELQNQINQTDKEIDKMVYELYELTAEEIEIVESSVK